MDAIFDGSLGGGTLALLILCLLVALGFEFVNGFHDTANAVATVIYTKTLKPVVAVVLSGICNFAGVFVGGIAVAIAIIRLLPVELLVSAGVGRGLAMVLSLLIAAMIWNIGTWWKGLPASSSHTLIGAITTRRGDGRLGDGRSLRRRRGLGQGDARRRDAAVLTARRLRARGGPALAHAQADQGQRVFESPRAGRRPRGSALLVLTCGGVSFARLERRTEGRGADHAHPHQRAPRAGGLRAEPRRAHAEVAEARAGTAAMLRHVAPLAAACEEGSDAPECMIHRELEIIVVALEGHATVRDIPAEERWGVRRIRIDDASITPEASANPAVMATLRADRAKIAPLTDYAPWWVVLAVALALGVGTMIRLEAHRGHRRRGRSASRT
ncbi:MAG: inorganic phosphate transporter [Sandaracinaceae bacterium]